MGAKELREQLIKKIEQADEKMLITYMNAITNTTIDEKDWADDISPELREALDYIDQHGSSETFTTEQVFKEVRAKYGL